MKEFLACLFAALGLTTACGQQNYENVEVKEFAELTADPNVVILDVRKADEFAEGHIAGAILIDQSQSDFVEQAQAKLPKEKTVAIYCRSGRRSASAAGKLAAEGYKCVNLKGGILAWKEAGKPVTTDTYEVDVFKTKSGKTVTFHALVHASIRIEYDGKEIQIDPVAKLGNKVIDYSAMPKADYLLVTHEHGDHFNPEAIKTLMDEKTLFITNQRCADMYGSGTVMVNGQCLMVNGESSMVNGESSMVNGQCSMVNDIKVEAVPAYNYTEGHTQFHPKGRDNGYILTLDGLRIYIAGDTEDIPEMADIKDIDIAFLPCNQPYTMTPDQLVKAARTIKPKVLFPYHYGQTDLSGIPGQLQGDGIDVRIRHYE